jgi:thiamine pyrophosphokinase
MSSHKTIWNPLNPFENETTIPFVLVILNQPINEDNEGYLRILWSKSCLRICADGAANRIYEWSARSNEELNYVPNYICGDLDSLRSEIGEFYKKHGTKIIRLHNQNYTDFHKTLKFSINCLKKSQFDKDLFENVDHFEDLNLKQESFKSIYIFCNFSGRVDHSIANLSTLYQINASDIENIVNIFIVSEESITFLLNQGINSINFNQKKVLGSYCGIFPLNKPSIVTTDGLKWNFNNQLCSFDGLISSSNEFDLNEKDAVFIETENPLLWTMSIKKI